MNGERLAFRVALIRLILVTLALLTLIHPHFALMSKALAQGGDAKKAATPPKTSPPKTQPKRRQPQTTSSSTSSVSRLTSFLGFNYGDPVAKVLAKLGEPGFDRGDAIYYFNRTLYIGKDGQGRITGLSIFGREAIEELRKRGMNDELLDGLGKPLSFFNKKYGQPRYAASYVGVPSDKSYEYKIRGMSYLYLTFLDSSGECTRISLNWKY